MEESQVHSHKSDSLWYASVTSAMSGSEERTLVRNAHTITTDSFSVHTRLLALETGSIYTAAGA